MKKQLALSIVFAILLTPLASMVAAENKPANAAYQGWQHCGSIFVLTTPEGVNLPASASEEGFPLLVRLDKDFFDFTQAKAQGEDVRFSSADGMPLAYQIEEWDAARGSASIWVRLANVKGNTRQEVKLYWGKADAASESGGKAVFNKSNGYLSVWHMNEPVKDEVGTLESKNTGTTAMAGMVGQGRHFAGRQGVFCGEKIPNYPSGAASHSTEAWFRAEKSNSTIIGWGNEGGGRGSKVRMQLRSPPHIHIDSDFSDVNGEGTLPLGEWIHVAHTYNGKEGRVYINGQLDGAATPTLNIKSPARCWLGGWYNNYDFVGDMDEVRISRVARSADWVKLEYENQKPLQTLAGPVVQAGAAFSVSPSSATVLEGKSATFSAQAGGAQKVYWVLKGDGKETLVAADRFHYTFDAGRVTGDKSTVLQFKAVYAGEVKTLDIPIAVKEDIPDPVLTLKAPATWDGRAIIEVTPQIANQAELQAKGAGDLNYTWSVSGIAVIKEAAPGKLVLHRAQNSGKMIVTARVHNGGAVVLASTTITVQEPARDAWVQRTPARNEKPVDNQFYARDDTNEGTLFWSGTLAEPADAVVLKVLADGQPYKTETCKPAADKSFTLSVKLKPGLIKYKAELVSVSAGQEKVLHTADNLICGDAYLIDGQSNAVATDFGKDDCAYTSDWIRSFSDGDPNKAWGKAVRRHGGRWEIGYWAMDLAKHLVETQKIPICIINGAVGGTLIEAHLRNPANPTDRETIYGRLLNRVRQAGLTHGIRGAFWHQGEADQQALGAAGGYGWETYEQYFVDMTAAWKQDYPNIQHYYSFQIWPNSCSMGGTRASDKLRDVQRILPRLYSNMSVMSTLGIKPEGPCHYPAAGYAEMARLIIPLVERYNYGKTFDKPITAPDVQKAYYTSDKKDEIALGFDQPMVWTEALKSQFYLDGKEGKVASGAVSGNIITLKLTAAADARTINYLADKKWNSGNLLYGQNGIAALTFCEVSISPAKPNP